MDKADISLPIAIETAYTTNLFHTLPLCVLKTVDNYNEWIIENYVNIQFLYPGWPFFLNQFNRSLVYSYDVFRCDVIPTQIKINNILEIIEDHLLNYKMYAYIMMDEYYLSCKASFGKMHFYHDSLIYGVDTKKRKFHALTSGEKEIIEKVDYEYYDVEQAFNGYIAAEQYNTISIIFFKPSPKGLPSFSYNNYLNNLISYTNGIANETRKPLFLLDINPTVLPPYGVYVQTILAAYLRKKDEWDFNDFKSLHFLWEHKAGLLKGFEFLFESGRTDVSIRGYIEEYKKIEEEMKNIRMLCLKQRITESMIYMTRICDKLSSLEKKERELLVAVTEYLKPFCENKKSISAPPLVLRSVYESINLFSFAKVQLQPKTAPEPYLYHCALTLSWSEKVYIRVIKFTGREKITLISENSTPISSNLVTEDIGQVRQMFLNKFCEIVSLDIYSNHPISVEGLHLEILTGSFLYGKSATASSCWPLDSYNFGPEKALIESEQYWNAQPDFPNEEYLEVDLEEDTTINHIVVKERPDVQRILYYKIESINNEGKRVLIDVHKGKLKHQAIVHKMDPISIRKLRLTILETEKDPYGYSEPGISLFEASYIPNGAIFR